MTVKYKDLLLIPISGRAPVILFFVLSGFVLANSYRASHFNDVIHFYVRRLFRIVPAAWLGLIATLAAFLISVRIDHSVPFADWLANRKNAGFHELFGSMVFANNDINPVYWTLHVELVGSLVLPLIIRLTWIAPLLLLLTIFPWHFVPLWGMTNALLFTFGFGVVAYKLAATGWEPPRWLWLTGLLLLLFSHSVVGSGSLIGERLGASALLRPNLPTPSNIGLAVQHLLETVGAFALVVSLSQRKFAVLEYRIIRYLGRVSFSIYIIHIPVLIVIVSILNRVTVNPDIALLSLIFSVFCCTIAIAGLVYRFIELPGINLGRLVLKYWSRPFSVGLPVAKMDPKSPR